MESPHPPLEQKMIPSRFVNVDQARQCFGSHVDRLAPFLLQGDPLADAVVSVFARMSPGKGRKLLDAALANSIGNVAGAPRPLKELFAHVEDVPFWLDRNQLELAGATHRRCGITGGLVLACCALPLIYGSPAMNKPLVFSRRLVERAARRLSETARFVAETCLPGGLKPYAEGWKITVKVRLMHAQVRRLLSQSGRWDTAAWGLPVNQVDMIHTNLLFSVALLDSLRKVGFHVSAAEGEAVMQLWRYSGYLLGSDPALLCATEEEGRRMLGLICSTEEPPDCDARDLTEALMKTAIPHVVLAGNANAERHRQRLTGFCYGLSYALIGSRVAAHLEYPPTWWRYTARGLTRAFITPVEVLRRLVPGAHRRAVARGTARVRKRLDQNKTAVHASFVMAEKLQESDSEPSVRSAGDKSHAG